MKRETTKAPFKTADAEAARLARVLEWQRIGNSAVREAQEENRRRGIPNWYSIGGAVISDQQAAKIKKR
jgi:hypothetical protein